MDNSVGIEKLLQWLRFEKASGYVYGRVLDFGGNNGEFGRYLQLNSISISSYTFVNDIKAVTGVYDAIMCLAVIEHIDVREVFKTFKILKNHLSCKGKIVVTTPSCMSKVLLQFLAFIGLLDKKNLAEHKHYWNRYELFALTGSNDLTFTYSKFQFGFNQLIVLK